MFRLGIWSQYYNGLSPEEAVERFVANGIYCSELADEHGMELLMRGDDVVKTGSEFKKYITDRGFEISQGHLCLKVKICSEDSGVEQLFRWVDLYEAIGIKNMVLHPDNLVGSGFSKAEKIERNANSLKILAEYINEREITICLENLSCLNMNEEEAVGRNADDLIEIIEKTDSEKIGICLDTGHLNLTFKNFGEFIRKAGKRLKALHIADNDGTADQHIMPFTRGCVDFVDVAKALYEVGYDGLFSLEIPGESLIPLSLRDEKIKFIKAGFDYIVDESTKMKTER